MQDKFIIALKIKKTIEYIKKAVDNYPHGYVVLKNNIMDSLYTLLRLSYKASIHKDIEIMKDIVVEIKMIEYFVSVSCNYELISYKKFTNVGKYLLEINAMVSSWIKNETNRKSIQQDN